MQGWDTHMPDSHFPTADGAGKVIIPFEVDQFHQLMKNCLGRPQTIEKSFSLSYALKPKHIADLNALIVERVSQQNLSQLIGFSARLSFSDNSIVTLDSFEALASYNVLKDVESTNLRLTWLYSITFQGKTAPEEQEISVTFASGSPGSFGAAFPHWGSVWDPSDGDISFVISHSERTWATDIQNILTAFITSLEPTDSSICESLRRWDRVIGLTVGALFLASSIATIFWTLSRTISRYKEQLAHLVAPSSGGDGELLILRKHVEFISDLIITRSTPTLGVAIMLYLCLSVILAVAAGAAVINVIPRRMGGFIILTQRTDETYRRRREREKASWRHVLLSSVAAIVLGVFGNYVFALLTR